MRLLFVIALLLTIPVAAGFGEELPGDYEVIGQISLEQVKWSACNEDYLYLLFGSSIGSVDLDQPGAELTIVDRVDLQSSYEFCELINQQLYLFTSGGQFAVINVDNDHLQLILEQLLPDSIFSAAAYGGYLYLAHGFSGISIVDIRNPDTLQIIDQVAVGVHYSHLEVYDSMLFAIDDFNGVDLYLIINDKLIYQTTFLTDYPPTDLCYNNSRLYVCYGREVMSEFDVAAGDQIVNEKQHQFNSRLFQLDNINDDALLGFEGGVVALYNLSAESLLAEYQLNAPIKKISLNISNPAPEVIAQTVLGTVSSLECYDGVFSLTSTFYSGVVPSSMAAAGSNLYIANSDGGIIRYDFSKPVPVPELFYPTGSVFSAMVVIDSLLFAATSNPGLIYVFDLSVTDQQPFVTFPSSIAAHTLQVERLNSKTCKLFCFGTGGAEAFEIDLSSGKVDNLWIHESLTPVVTGYGYRGLFLLATDNAALDIYSAIYRYASPLLAKHFLLPTFTRAVTVVENQYLVLGGNDGISINYLFAPYDEIEPLLDFDGIGKIYDMAWEPTEGYFAAACGDQGIVYFYLSEALSEGNIYRIDEPQGVSAIAASGSYIYSLSENAIISYKIGNTESLIPENHPADHFVSFNYPNPFNDETMLEIISESGNIYDGFGRFQVFNTLGQLVRDEDFDGRTPQVTLSWNATNQAHQKVTSGLYFLRVTFGKQSFSRKVVYLK